MNPTILFNREVNFLGRNGHFKCAGLELFVSPSRNVVTLTPITSKGEQGRCFTQIPKESLQHVINLLQRIADDLVAAQGSDTTGGESSTTADPQNA